MKKAWSNKMFIPVILILSCIFFFACNDQENKKEYYKVPWQAGSILFDHNWPSRFSSDITKITSQAELNEYDIDSLYYSDVFFETTTLLLFEFVYEGGEKNITLHDFVTDNTNLYPIFIIDSQQILDAVINYKIFSIEVSNAELKYELGNILVINNYNNNIGSTHHERFDGVIKEPEA